MKNQLLLSQHQTRYYGCARASKRRRRGYEGEEEEEASPMEIRHQNTNPQDDPHCHGSIEEKEVKSRQKLGKEIMKGIANKRSMKSCHNMGFH